MADNAVFTVMRYLGDLQELKDLYNTHYGLVDGDMNYWADYDSSPIWPVNEQPESDKFYILYNWADSFEPETWWHITAEISLIIITNNLKLIDDVSGVVKDAVKQYDEAAARINRWAMVNVPNSRPINWTQYVTGEMILAAEQENGVYFKELLLRVNSTDC